MGVWDWLKSLFVGAAPPPPSPAAPVATPFAPGRPAPTRPQPRSYAANPEVLGLSPAEFRQRALRVVPWKTAWIGRVDTIPPQTDERTALIDRGLVLRGLLTEADLAEIHTVGDAWLRHHDAVRLAGIVGRAQGEAAVQELREQRARRKLERRAAAALRREQLSAERARRRATDVIFVGRGVSAGLADRRSHVERLERAGLPVLSTPGDLAAAMGVPVSRLRWLAFHADAVTRPHYVAFTIPKRSGGVRRLASPKPALREAQAWIFEHVLGRLEPSDQAHGFVRGRSTVTNALPHVGRDVVVNLDLADFFPTITLPRVRGLFRALGYSPAVATLLALLCTESPREPVDYDGQRWYVAVGPRGLPQGACTSPAISNAIARKLDARLTGLASGMGFVYTRYADDLTFSAPVGHRDAIGRLLGRVERLLREEGFRKNEDKGRIQRKGRRQTVTGIVVNRRPGLPREEVRRLRAILHQARRDGLEAQNREGRPNFEAWLRGKLAYLAMVEPERGRRMLAELDALVGRVSSA